MKPNSSNIAHFPIKNYSNLHFTNTPQIQFFPTVPHTYFSTKFRTTFIFIEVFKDDKPDTCATPIQNSTNHIATLPTGHIGYIDVPITNENPKYYHVNDINTLKHNVTHTYHPEITKIIPQTNYSLQYKDATVPFHQFSLHQVYMPNSDVPQNLHLSKMYILLHISQNLEIFIHYYTPQKIFFSLTYFSTKFRTTFNFIEVFTDDKPDTCATPIKNSTNHIATLPTGHIGYIDVPITNENPNLIISMILTL